MHQYVHNAQIHTTHDHELYLQFINAKLKCYTEHTIISPNNILSLS